MLHHPTPTIAITMGDPSGVGPELTILGALSLAQEGTAQPLIVGDYRRLKEAAAILSQAGRLPTVPQFVPVEHPGKIPAPGAHPTTLSVLDLKNVPCDLPWGSISTEAGQASFAYVKRAVTLALAGTVDAICTAPIHKKAWELAGVNFPGHTEALAQLSGASQYAMMLKNQQLRVVHCTTHIPFVAIVRRLTSERIVSVCHLAHAYLRQIGIVQPQIAVAGLNPHAGDQGLFGGEEVDLIHPAIVQAQTDGLAVSGPWPADTIFARAAAGEFDIVVALYHDQGHIAIKMLGIDTGVNETIGLPLIRTSVDHGTAFDIAGKGVAQATSMIYALKAAADDAAMQVATKEQ